MIKTRIIHQVETEQRVNNPWFFEKIDLSTKYCFTQENGKLSLTAGENSYATASQSNCDLFMFTIWF